MSVAEELGPLRQTRLPAGTIAYRDTGTGPPVVFVHGLFVNGDLWRKVVPALAPAHRCITPDWPLGSHTIPMSPEADLTPPGLAAVVSDFLDGLGLSDVTLVGNDTGGAVCQLVAVRHPGRIGRLVLVSCDAFDVFPPRLFAYLKLVARTPGGTFLAAQSLRSRRFRRLPITYGWAMRVQPEREVAESYTRALATSRGVRRDARKVLRGTSRRHTLEAAARFGDFDRPVLVAWGGDDRFFPLALGERLAAAFGRSRLEVIDDARTFVPEDHPRQLAGLIEAFVVDRAPVPST